MKNWFQRSIRNKLATVILVAVVPSVLIVSVLGSWWEAEWQLASKHTELEGIAAALAASVSEPLATAERRQVANALKGVGAIRGITHVSVADAAGNTVFQFGNGILVTGASRHGMLFNIKTYPVNAVITHAGRRIGSLTLIADISDVTAALLRSLWFATAAGLLSALTGILLAYKIQRSITTPVGQLTAAMDQIRETRDFSRTIERTSSDETGMLVSAFNGMLREIRSRDTALAQYSAGLELQVADRTRDLALATEAAQSANAAKSVFLATMSHEIRTPMNGMLVMAELLAAGDLSPRAQRQCEVILRSGQTLLSIINDILDLSKIEAGRLTLESVPVDPCGVVSDVLALFSERGSVQGLQLAYDAAPGVPKAILGDPVRLSQILSNLVNNALKFTETGGVLVRIAPGAVDAGTLRFSVIDSGIGIAADKLPLVFEAFTQAEQSTTRRYGGTGIGLTICRQLVEAMGGKIEVSRTLGAGSEFSFHIPVEVVTAADAVPPVLDAGGCAVLLLQPGPIRTVFERLVGEFGLDMATSPAGVARARIIVTDTATLAANPQLSERLGCRVVVLSGMGDALADTALKLGHAQDALELPLDGQDARDVFARALGGLEPLAATRRIANARPVESVAAFAGVRVLAADDSAINREVLIEALRRLGATVTSVEDGAAAVAAVKAEHFDLVFMDGNMPVMDGFEATRMIRAWEQETGRESLPVVGLSAQVMGARPEVWRNAGMSDFISKPFTLAAITACIERHVDVGSAVRGTAVVLADIAPLASAGLEQDAGGGTAQLVDAEVLRSIEEMQAPGDDLVGRVIALYAEHAPRLFERLLDCGMRPEDTDALATAAHALKSLCRNVGAIRVGDFCDAIENEARGGRSVLDAYAPALAKALPETLSELARFGSQNVAA